MHRLQELLGPRPDSGAVAAQLEALDPVRRRDECLSLQPWHLSRLFEVAKGARTLRLGDLVPSRRAPLEPIVHDGRNTLPVFRRFAKVMARAPEGGEELWGYNRTGRLLETLVGPGYFVVRPHEVPGELAVDYRVLPRVPAPGWPPLRPNAAGLGRVVYAGTVDVLRGVTAHVSIGRASRDGRFLPAFFVLCRAAR